jgi:DNA-binding MarR family transcriptional regulator
MTEQAARAERALDELSELYAHLMRVGRSRTDRYSLTRTEGLALLELALDGPLRIRELARRTNSTAATASRSVDTLEQLRLATRRPSATDRRSVLAVATAEGKRWAAQQRGIYREALASGRPVPEQLIHLLTRLNASLRGARATEEDGPRQLLFAPPSPGRSGELLGDGTC